MLKTINFHHIVNKAYDTGTVSTLNRTMKRFQERNDILYVIHGTECKDAIYPVEIYSAEVTDTENTKPMMAGALVLSNKIWAVHT